MPVIIPATCLYFNLDDGDDDDGSNGGGHTGGGGNGSGCVGCAALLGVLITVSYFAYLEYKGSPSKIYEKELKYGTEQILNIAHVDAVNSANTINVDEYELVSPRVAKRDSACYARKITRFIKRSGTEFLGWEPDVTRKIYVLTVDKNRIAKDTNFVKLSNGYKHAVEQLAVQRRISKQK